MMTVGQLRQLEQAADHCGHCELRGDRLFVCQYHEGWGDALDAARFPALLDIAEAAVALVEKQDGSDPRDTAIEEFDLRIAVCYLASRLDTEGRHG